MVLGMHGRQMLLLLPASSNGLEPCPGSSNGDPLMLVDRVIHIQVDVGAAWSPGQVPCVRWPISYKTFFDLRNGRRFASVGWRGHLALSAGRAADRSCCSWRMLDLSTSSVLAISISRALSAFRLFPTATAVANQDLAWRSVSRQQIAGQCQLHHSYPASVRRSFLFSRCVSITARLQNPRGLHLSERNTRSGQFCDLRGVLSQRF